MYRIRTRHNISETRMKGFSFYCKILFEGPTISSTREFLIPGDCHSKAKINVEYEVLAAKFNAIISQYLSNLIESSFFLKHMHGITLLDIITLSYLSQNQSS